MAGWPVSAEATRWLCWNSNKDSKVKSTIRFCPVFFSTAFTCSLRQSRFAPVVAVATPAIEGSGLLPDELAKDLKYLGAIAVPTNSKRENSPELGSDCLPKRQRSLGFISNLNWKHTVQSIHLTGHCNLLVDMSLCAMQLKLEGACCEILRAEMDLRNFRTMYWVWGLPANLRDKRRQTTPFKNNYYNIITPFCNSVFKLRTNRLSLFVMQLQICCQPRLWPLPMDDTLRTGVWKYDMVFEKLMTENESFLRCFAIENIESIWGTHWRWDCLPTNLPSLSISCAGFLYDIIILSCCWLSRETVLCQSGLRPLLTNDLLFKNAVANLSRCVLLSHIGKIHDNIRKLFNWWK